MTSSRQKIVPFLWFNKEAEEAMKFYVSIFKNSRIVNINRYPKGPLEGPMKGMEGKVRGALFQLEGQSFMALDGGPLFKPTAAHSFYIECKTQKEIDYYWNKLTEGGDPETQRCGWLNDKFGFTWQIIPTALPHLLADPDKMKADRVMKAMLKMKKIDIEGLKRA